MVLSLTQLLLTRLLTTCLPPLDHSLITWLPTHLTALSLMQLLPTCPLIYPPTRTTTLMHMLRNSSAIGQKVCALSFWPSILPTIVLWQQKATLVPKGTLTPLSMHIFTNSHEGSRCWKAPHHEQLNSLIQMLGHLRNSPLWKCSRSSTKPLPCAR